MQLNKGFFACLLVSVVTVWGLGAPSASAFSFSSLWNTIIGVEEKKVVPVNTSSATQTIPAQMSSGSLLTYGDVAMIMESFPADGAIDARAPYLNIKTDVEPVIVGWDQVEIVFDREPIEVNLNDFQISNTLRTPVNVAVESITSTSSNRLILNLNQSIPVLARTSILYRPTGQRICLGYLPGDVDQNGITDANDAFQLLGELGKDDSIAHEQMHAYDIDRSGIFDGADASRLMAMLSGRDGMQKWKGETIPNDCE